MSGIQSSNPSAQALPRSLSRNAVGRVDRLKATSAFRPRLHRHGGIAAPKPLTWSRPRGTNPIVSGRVSGFVQSGFNEVAHRASPTLPAARPHRTLQIPKSAAD